MGTVVLQLACVATAVVFDLVTTNTLTGLSFAVLVVVTGWALYRMGAAVR